MNATTDFQPLNSAEEVQRAFESGRPVECSRPDAWARIEKFIGVDPVASLIDRGYQYRTPKAAPTPEAERPALVGGVTSGDVDHLIASLQSARDRMLRVLPEKFGEGFDGDMDTLLDAVRYLKRLKRVALPAAQDGDAVELACPACGHWGADFTTVRASEDDWDVICPECGCEDGDEPRRVIEQMVRDRDEATPNAIRGDKGAEAVDALPIRDVKEIVSKYVGRTSRIYLYIANDLSQLHREQLAAAPTQAAAKDTP